ncbi:hypothetical protein V6N13_048980 [Hibiscus sabdariffa]
MVKEQYLTDIIVHVCVIGRYGYRSINFLSEIDVRNLDLDSLVQFNNREVIVYMDNNKKSLIGQGLNKHAVAVMAEARSQQAASLTEFRWLGNRFPITNAKTRVAILKGSAENVKDDLNGLDKAVSVVLGQQTIECNQLLVSIAKSKLTRHRDDKNEKNTLYFRARSLAENALHKFQTHSKTDQVSSYYLQAMIKKLKTLYDECRAYSCIELATGINEEVKAPDNLSKKISTISLSGADKKVSFIYLSCIYSFIDLHLF